MRWVLIHLPHLLPPLLAFGFLARLGAWAADPPPQHYEDHEIRAWQEEREAKRSARRRPVRRRVGMLGTIALAPILLAMLTGLVIYTFNLRGDRPSDLLVWTHTIVSVAALALTTV